MCQFLKIAKSAKSVNPVVQCTEGFFNTSSSLTMSPLCAGNLRTRAETDPRAMFYIYCIQNWGRKSPGSPPPPLIRRFCQIRRRWGGGGVSKNIPSKVPATPPTPISSCLACCGMGSHMMRSEVQFNAVLVYYIFDSD